MELRVFSLHNQRLVGGCDWEGGGIGKLGEALEKPKEIK